MKKLFFIGAALLICAFYANAQETDSPSTGKDRLEKLEELADKAKEAKAKKSEKLVNFEVLHRFGYGAHMVTADEFSEKALDNREIWFNAMDLSLNPAHWFSVSLELNLKWDKFKASPYNYLYADVTDDNLAKFAPIATQEALYPAAAGEFNKLASQVNVFELEVPLLLNFKVGDFGIKLGGQAILPLTAKQKEIAKYGDVVKKSQVKHVKTGDFWYGAFLELNYNEVGLYAKYIPTAVVPGIVDDLFTLGLSFGF